MLQNADVHGTKRQIRYALRQAGITIGERRDARRELRESSVQDMQTPVLDESDAAVQTAEHVAGSAQ